MDPKLTEPVNKAIATRKKRWNSFQLQKYFRPKYWLSPVCLLCLVDRNRVDDAMHATRAAVEEGILPGGGVALLRAIKAFDKLKVDNDDQRSGIDIVRKAISWPAS